MPVAPSSRRSRIRLAALCAAALLPSVATPAWAQAPKLGIKPVGQTGSFFEMTMAPGERRDLAVELSNHGDATVAAGASVVAVEVANTGNVRLRPAGEVVVTDSGGREVSRTRVAMESFYAGTATSVEAPQHRLLEPGGYRVRVALDYQGGRAEAADLALDVPVGEELAVRTPEGAAKAPEAASETAGDGLATSALIGGAVGLLVLVGTALAGVLRRRRAAPARARAGAHGDDS